MAAVIRGGSRYGAAPRPKTAKKTPMARPRQASRPHAPAPAKIRAAQAMGLKPGMALIVSTAVMAAALLVALFTGDRLARTTDSVGQAIDRQLGAVGFRVASVQVEGATPAARADILRGAALTKDQPILGLDLTQLRGRVEHVGWVKSARVVRLLPNTVVISVAQRLTTAVWQFNGHTSVVDDTGQVIAEADPGRFPDLPLVVGQGANEAAGDILALLRTRPWLMQRVDALVRVDERRWDVRLKDGSLIELPAAGEESALIQLDQLNQKQRILELGFARIDLRDPELVAVRPKENTTPVSPAPAGT